MAAKLIVFFEITNHESIDIPDNATGESIETAVQEFQRDLAKRHKYDGEVRVYHYEKE